MGVELPLLPHWFHEFGSQPDAYTVEAVLNALPLPAGRGRPSADPRVAAVDAVEWAASLLALSGHPSALNLKERVRVLHEPLVELNRKALIPKGDGNSGKVYRGLLRHGPLLRALALPAADDPQLLAQPPADGTLDVVVKVLHLALAGDEAEVCHGRVVMFAEAVVSAHIAQWGPHPNVAQLLGVLQPRGRPVELVFDFQEHGSLETYLGRVDVRQRLRASPALIVDLLLDMARGLKHLHDHAFVHRDVALRNFLVSASGSAVLSDFGLTRHERCNDRPPREGLDPPTPLELYEFDPPRPRASDLRMLGLAFCDVLLALNDRPFGRGRKCFYVYSKKSPHGQRRRVQVGTIDDAVYEAAECFAALSMGPATAARQAARLLREMLEPAADSKFAVDDVISQLSALQEVLAPVASDHDHEAGPVAAAPPASSAADRDAPSEADPVPVQPGPAAPLPAVTAADPRPSGPSPPVPEREQPAPRGPRARGRKKKRSGQR
jgi:serine/threonine protein kinase